MKKIIKTLIFIFSKIEKYKRKYIISILVSIFANVIRVWINIAMIGILIGMLQNGNIENAALLTVVAFFIVSIVNVIANYVNMNIKLISNDIDNQLNIQVYQNMINLQYSEQEKEETRKEYEFSKIAINEVGILKITENIKSIAESLLNIVVSTITLSVINIYILIAVVIVAGINIISEIHKMRCEYILHEEMSSVELNLYYARDYLVSPAFAKEIRTLSMMNYVLTKLNKVIERFTKIRIQTEMKYLKKFGIVYFLDGLLLVAIYLFGIYEYVKGNMEISFFSVYLSAMTTLVFYILNGIKTSVEISENSQYIRVLEGFLVKKDSKDYDEEISERLEETKTSEWSVEFKNVSFKYPGAENYTLSNISFKVSDGQKIVIVGRNGAGKTTLIKLLLRLYVPTSGTILFNGYDYQSITEEEIKKIYSVVLQDFSIYPFSINTNVSMGQNDVPMGNIEKEKINECIKKVGLGEKIDLLIDRGETYITRRLNGNGVELSGGESQKLAMARAIYKSSHIYVFDEPTSALSPQSEYDIYKRFREITEGKLTFFISHRLASCRLCDKVVVLDNGEIENVGTHEELMKFDNLYSKMFNVQAESFNI